MDEEYVAQAERVRERRRINQRQRRAAMSEEQRRAESDRRRRTYQMRTLNISNVQIENRSTETLNIEDMEMNDQSMTEARSVAIVTSTTGASTSGTSNIHDFPRSSSDFENEGDRGQVFHQQIRHSNSYNCARNFHENHDALKHRLPVPTICTKCQAKLFKSETRGLCCRNGAIVLPEIPVPEELLGLFADQSAEGKLFRHNIRSYNHVFSFTSMGVKLDENLANAQHGVYTFRAHGAIYHKIGSLLPNPGDRPRFLQLYIYDTEHETDNRSAERRQYSLPTASQVAAILLGLDDITEVTKRDIVVQTVGGNLLTVQEYSGYYDPLQYPLLHPFGTYGWNIDYRTHTNRKITSCDYYSYMLQIRGVPSIFLRAGRLLQQYSVDNYVKIETGRLRWISTHQKDIRCDLYQGLQDCLIAGENNAGNVGEEPTVLPSSFTGGRRDMYQRYLDAMAVVQKYGKPDLFITMTCNPQWEEIKRELLIGQVPQDRPDLLTRIFRAKFEELKFDLFQRNILGKVVAHVHVIEFQKRGLPHAQMLIILDDKDKLRTPDDYDQIVRAEIPYNNEEPELYNIIMRHMIHGPCGALNTRAPCMKNGKCKKDFPKRFSPTTIQGNDSYPIYRRRDHRSIALDSDGEILIDNGWVVPYNAWLLLKYDCHINVEICSSVKSVKYLYKYVYKGPDCVTFELRSELEVNEVKEFVDGRWICAPEALWRIFQFPMSKICPSAERLQIHLPNMQQVRFYSHQTISEVISEPRNSRTMLTEFFRIYAEEREPTKYLYREIPEYYRWIPQQKNMAKESFPYESNWKGPKSFDDLLTVNGVHYLTFKQAAEEYGLLESDNSISQALAEAREIKMPKALRRLFATILIYTNPCDVRKLWDDNFLAMVEDYPSSSDTNNVFLRNKLLKDISKLLDQQNKKLKEFDLPQMTEGFEELASTFTLIEDELSIPVSDEDLNCITMLNQGQFQAFNTIKGSIEEKKDCIFFVDGPGGTGKTYLYRALLAHFRGQRSILIATATSGIASMLLSGGRTTHSRFKIPILLEPGSKCRIKKQSELCELIRTSAAIIWDEAPMADRKAFEALDKTFRFLLDNQLPFGGKIMILGGDFRQVLPVVLRGTREQTVMASIVQSSLWKNVTILHLHENMRAHNDNEFSNFLLRVGDGDVPTISNDMIRIPDLIAIPWEGDESITRLIEFTFPNLSRHAYDVDYMMDRALITPLNDDVNKLNEKIIQSFPGEEMKYYTFDSVPDDMQNLYQQEFLNSLAPGNFPPHKLTLKKGAPIMLLRNIDPKSGLCNGTRLLCRSFGRNVIDAEILNGQYKGTRVFIPRIPLKTAEDAKLPFDMTRRTFPVRLSFAITINKSQGQTIPNVGIYLPNHVFSHGQLYVSLSRGVSSRTTRILIKDGTLDGEDGVYTKNIVYKEIFLKLTRHVNVS